jgi:lipopolysaccharide/colanic/teichoic acid biosynthesis glycosyltransferase
VIRLRDFALGLLLAGILLPFIAGIALSVRREGAPVFFRQRRLGRGGAEFFLLKFRTMENRPGPAVTAADDPRITRLGRRLRHHRLDELPQLWNLIRGDMGFVGPRPEHPAFAAEYRRLAPELLELRPGLTDASTLEYLDEEARLAGVADPEAVYRRDILPEKLACARRAAARRGLCSDLRVMSATAIRLATRGRKR